jgi:hypothetical protein
MTMWPSQFLSGQRAGLDEVALHLVHLYTGVMSAFLVGSVGSYDTELASALLLDQPTATTPSGASLSELVARDG